MPRCNVGTENGTPIDINYDRGAALPPVDLGIEGRRSGAVEQLAHRHSSVMRQRSSALWRASAAAPLPASATARGNCRHVCGVAASRQSVPRSGRFSFLRYWDEDRGPVDALWAIGVAGSPVVAAM
jgi:hypothetical protein